ncbi:MAG TPA: ABC transporter ATP-binding protein, partial [Thermoplasmatales archaeon]|nr:ABC transporter ATP-binding protein [Thermoplasmatales archaeon]
NGVKVVDNISFSVRKGEIFGLLGPNGAGKSTTIKAMLGLIYPSSGEIRVNGFDIIKEGKYVREHIGYLPENITFYDNLTALQTLYFYSDMRSISKDDCLSLLEEFELREFANKRVGTFSKGMVRRLGLVQAFLGKPKLVILDEPTIGLDPSGVVKVREKIRSLRKSGTTVFLSSHILSEVQKVCDRVGIMNKGVLVAVDAVANLTKESSLEEVFMKYTRR